MNRRHVVLGLLSVTSLLDAPLLRAAHVGPDPVQFTAVEGIVRKSDAKAGAMIVRAADGVDHLVHVTDRTVVHGKATTEAFHGLREGSHVIVHYTAKGGEKTAEEVDRVGDDGLQMMEGRVTHIDRKAKQLSITLADGSKETLRLTERAAAGAAEDVDRATGDASKVVVYYADDAGERVAHFFKRIR